MLVSAGARFLAALGRRPSCGAAAISRVPSEFGILYVFRGSDDNYEVGVPFGRAKCCNASTPASTTSNSDTSADSTSSTDSSYSCHDSASGSVHTAPSDSANRVEAPPHSLDTAGADGAAAASSPSRNGVHQLERTRTSTSGPASRRDKNAAAETIYPSSRDDNLGVQKNWFNALFSQLNVVHRTGMVPHMKGRQQEIFCSLEREFEGLWERHVRGRGLEGNAHRGMLLCCLAIATHRVLRYESGDDEMVKEVVRTNLGGVAVSVMMRLHSARLWLLLRLLAEDPYKEAVRFLPSLQSDLGSLVAGEVAVGAGEATWTARSCAFHSVLAAEDATELLPEFCCQFGMQWLEAFASYGVRVGLEQSLGFGDDCCMVRISKPGITHCPAPSTAAPRAPTSTSSSDNSSQTDEKQA